jgi:putative DNA primase/helicase
MKTPLDQFREALAGRGILPPDELIADGAIHRCDAEAEGRKGKGDASYLLHLNSTPAGGFENFRDGLGWQNWRADAVRILTPAEESAHRAKIEAAQRQRQADEAKRHEEARRICALVWNKALPVDPEAPHPYLAKKGVRSYGLRVTKDGRLLIPVRDAAGTLHSLQFIGADGTKRFKTGGRKHGCYYAIGKPNGTLYIAEGYATGASIHEATRHAVAVAFDAGNLLPVAKALRAKLPDVKIILCADDDSCTEGNPGLTKATEAARAVDGLLAVPDFHGRRSS